MAQRRWWSRRSFTVGLGVAATVAAVVTGMAQSSTDKWWPGYGSGPDNSRYFASRQINKSNVNQLQVAWTYPFGDTGSPPDRRPRRDLRPRPQRIARRRRREDRQGAVGPRKHERHDQPRHQLLGERRRPRPAPDLRDEQPAAGGRREDRQVRSCRSAPTASSICASASTAAIRRRSATSSRTHPGEVFENLIILGSATGEGYMSPPGDIRAYDVLTGKLVWTFHTVPRPGEFGYDTWPKDAWKYIGGVNNWGEMTVDTAARHRLHSARLAHLRLLRRRPHRRQPVRHVDRRARRAHRQAAVALPVRASRPLGPRPERGAAADDHPPQRPQPRRGRGRRARPAWLYVFDRVTGEPIWPIEERPVPKSEMPGEQSWPTQPHPTKPAAVHASTLHASTTSARICRPTKRRRSGSGCSRPTTRASSRQSA